MQKWKSSDYRLLVLGIISLLTFIYLYPDLFSTASISFEVSKQDIIDKAESFLHDMGYSVSDSPLTIELKHDADQMRYLQKTYGTRIANQCMRDSLPVFFWDLSWNIKSERTAGSIVTIDSDGSVSKPASTIRMGIDLEGNPTFFEFMQKAEETVADTNFTGYKKEVLNQQTAEKLARQIIDSNFNNWLLDTLYSPVNHPEQMSFIWKRKHSLVNQTPYLEVRLESGKIIRFDKYYQGPKVPSVSDQKEDLYGILSFFLIYIFFIILGAIFFFNRLRSDKLDLKSGLIPALIVLAGWCITYWIQNPGQNLLELIISFLIITPFVAGGLWIMFIIGESYTRETWPHRLAVIDKLRQFFCFPELGASILRGLALMSIGLGLLSLLTYISINLLNAYCVVHDMILHFWTTSYAAPYALGISLLRAVYIVVSFCLFFTSFLRQRIRNKTLFWIILFIFWSFISLPLPQTMPYFSRMSLNGMLGLLITYFFIRYNFATALVGSVGMPVFYFATSALFSGYPTMIIHGIILLLFLFVLLLIACQSYRGNVPVGTVTTYVPDYVQRIYEKERIQRELEIARNVQANFLPRSTPNIKGLDIASLCSPAKEVGGDYYDFIQLTPSKLGLCIGDVSGKGISAAFYMTLTKGFLQSQARSYRSPRDVLIHINELFYENANREMFISMIYGVYDLSEHKLTLARAGHSPILVYRKAEHILVEYDPPGIALGLDCSDLFISSIEEIEIPFSRGDAFLFYTDGINEAQNRFKEEFGEERLKETVLKHIDLKGDAFLQALNSEIKGFTGSVLQHDDMTVLIIKVESSV